MQRLLLFAFLIILPFSAGAQGKFYQPDASVKVYAYGKEQTLAWCAGFNDPQFTMADLNHDGLQDLIVYETGNSLRTFLNVGTPGNPDYRYAPHYEVNFPPISEYIILTDYNCDNIPDLFQQQTVDGFSVYKGYYNSANELCFTYYRDLFFNNRRYVWGVNAFNNPADIPSIVDVDGDGDLDFVAYDVSGGTINYYKNMRVELGLPCDSIHIDWEQDCWGKVYQGFYRTHELHYPDCPAFRQSLDTLARVMHQGNTPCLFDWDMDGDYDYLDGSVSFNEMTFLKNGRIEYNPTGPDSMVFQDTMWQTLGGGMQVELPTWPAAFNVDIDQDVKKDLLIAPNAQLLSENYHCIWFYKNYSTPGSPDWRFQSDSFLTDKSIDLGSYTYPVLFDYDKDGKPDLFIGSGGYFHINDALRSRLSLYKNTSVPGNPSLTLQTTDFLNIDTFKFIGAAPAFGDIDNDGKSDLIIGHSDGTLSYFKNMAASESVTPDWQLQQLMLTDVNGDTINVSESATPFIYDLDKDGKKDLLIGDWYGTIEYYRNISTVPGGIKLQLVNTAIGGIKADGNRNHGNYSVPFIGKIDSTNTDFLLVGSNSGAIYRYTGFQTGDTTATYTMLDSVYSYIDSAYRIYPYITWPSIPSYAAYDDMRSSVAVGDIAGDGSYYMVVGSNKGGLELYKWETLVPQVTPNITNEAGKIFLFPNPADDKLNITWSGIAQPQLQLSIVNMAGQTFYTTTIPTVVGETVITTKDMAPGMYVCVIQSGVSRYYSKFTVIR